MQKGEVMHIQNQLRSYVLTRHGEGGLLHEFYNYSSFTKKSRAASVRFNAFASF